MGLRPRARAYDWQPLSIWNTNHLANKEIRWINTWIYSHNCFYGSLETLCNKPKRIISFNDIGMQSSRAGSLISAASPLFLVAGPSPWPLRYLSIRSPGNTDYLADKQIIGSHTWVRFHDCLYGSKMPLRNKPKRVFGLNRVGI